MDPDSLAGSKTKNAPRKVKFAPKAPPKREPKLVLPKPEKLENDVDDAKAEHLLRRLNETTVTGKAKAERKVGKTQVAFGFGGSSSSIRSYSTSKNINRNQGASSDGGIEKEYKEPWNYYSNYPVTLPLRRPYSGNPELLDKEEFNEDPQNTSYDENEMNSAVELGLLEDNVENNLFFFQLPNTLPMVKQSTDAEVQQPENGSQKPFNLEEIPEGLMGKMLVYKNGAIKLKLGNTLYDVSAGLDFVFAQDVVAMNTEDRHCCNLGELSKCAVVTPDIDSMLDEE